MAKWTTEETADGFCLACDGKQIFDNGLPHIAHKLNAFDEMRQEIVWLRDWMKRRRDSDGAAVYELKQRIGQVEGLIAALDAANVPQAYPEGSPTIEEMKGLLDRKEGRDV